MATGDRDVNIHLRLFDDFSSAAQRIQTNVTKIGEGLDRAGRQMQQFGSRMTFLGSAVTGAFLISMKAVEDASPRVQRTMGELGNVFRNLQLSIAEAAVPAVQKMVDVLAGLVNAWNSLAPQTREQIVQMVFMTGVALAATGAFLKFTGVIISLAGKITTLVSWISKKNLAIAAVTVAIGYMIANWEKVRDYVLPIVRALQIAGDAVAIAYLEFGRALLWVTDKALAPFVRAALGILPILEATKVVSKETAADWRQSLEGISGGFEGWRDKMGAEVDRLKQDMKNAAEGTGETWATTLDEVMTTAERFVDDTGKVIQEVVDRVSNSIKNQTGTAKDAVVNWAGLMKDTVQRVANAMTQSLGNFFYNSFTGQLKSAKQAIVEFGQSVLRILSDVLAKILLTKVLGSALNSIVPGAGFFHSGGIARKKAHSGTLAQDEVSIIAQDGEGILSRQGVNALGKGNLARLNRGEPVAGGGGGGEKPVVIIQAWDAADVQRNSKMIEKVIGDAFKRNSGLRGIVKQHG